MRKFKVTARLLLYSQVPNSHRNFKSKHVKAFLNRFTTELKGRGCYIFSRKAAKGELPFYVGLAAKQSFADECFTAHKMAILKDELIESKKGSLYLYLIEPFTQNGKFPAEMTGDVERFLIGAALKANMKLRNSKHAKQQAWAIQGLVRSTKGKPTKTSAKLKKVLKLSGK